MRRALLDYHLPPERIAVRPLSERDAARLLVVDAGGALAHRSVRDLDQLVAPGSLLVVNDTRVLPARLLGHKAGSGGKVEILLVRRLADATVQVTGESRYDGAASGPKPQAPSEPREAARWAALGRASKPLRPGARLLFGDGALEAEILSPPADGGLLEVLLFSPSGIALEAAIHAVGHVPLPPYLHRDDEPADRERYQTVFARNPGAVAAPTAGLHLSTALLDRLEARGVALAPVTLHVGLGTFQPVTAEDLDDHPMHSEVFSVSPQTAAAIARARERNAPVVAVGTTVVRALESAADPERPGHVRPREGETRLLIQPGHRFRIVDQLLTNFHLPQSTLLALVAAFAGTEHVLAAYQAAIDADYRFYSYGDAMLLRSRSEAPA